MVVMEGFFAREDPITEYYEDRVRGEEIRDLIAEDLELMESDDDEYLDRIGASEDEGEDDTVFNNLLHPDRDAWMPPPGNDAPVRPVRRGGHRITRIGANEVQAGTLAIGNARFSETDISHPVVDRIETGLNITQADVERQQDRIEGLERRYNNLVEVAESQTKLIQALIRKLGI